MNFLEEIGTTSFCEHNVPINYKCRICEFVKQIQAEQTKLKQIKKQDISANLLSIAKFRKTKKEQIKKQNLN